MALVCQHSGGGARWGSLTRTSGSGTGGEARLGLSWWRSPCARWGQEDFEAIFDGWCWARTVGRTAARLTAPPAVASAANVAARRHCAATVGTPYPGKGLLKRLDAAVGRLLTHLAALPNDGEEETGQGWGMV